MLLFLEDYICLKSEIFSAKIGKQVPLKVNACARAINISLFVFMQYHIY